MRVVNTDKAMDEIDPEPSSNMEIEDSSDETFFYQLYLVSVSKARCHVLDCVQQASHHCHPLILQTSQRSHLGLEEGV